MKNQTLCLLLMLSLLLGQNSIAEANSGGSDPMNVKTTNSATVSVSEKKAATEKEEAVKPSKEEKKEEVKEEESKPKEKQVVTHSVKQGESLWRIAQQYLGDGNRWRELVELNKEAYPTLEKNPNLIYTGWQIKVALDDENNNGSQTIDNATTDSNNTASSTVSISDSSTDSSSVNQSEIPNWTIQQKIDKLQECLDKANRALLAQKKKIADLNLGTITFMIKHGFMKQEDWMAMNPPIGYTYRINSKGDVELVNTKNVALTTAEIAKLDSKLATSTDNSAAKNPTSINSGTKPTNGASAPIIHGGSGGKFDSNANKKEKNPIPPAHQGGTSSSGSAAGKAGETIGGLFKTISDLVSDAKKTAKEVGEDVKQAGKDFSDAAKETAKDAKQFGKDLADDAKNTAQAVTNSTKETAKDITDVIKQIGDDFKDGYDRGYNRDYYGKGSDLDNERRIAEEDFKVKQEAHDAYIRSLRRQRLLEEK